MNHLITIIAALLLTGCNGINTAKQINAMAIDYPVLPDNVQVGQSLLSRDTIVPDTFPVLNAEQISDLARQTALEVPDSTLLIGMRPVKDGITLAAYKAPIADKHPGRFKVYLTTCDNKGAVIDALDLQEFHTSQYQGRPRLGGNRFYTTDAELRFVDAHHFTLHRVMTLTSLYLKDHTLTEGWRVEWDNNYEITADGHFLFKGQQETLRSHDINDPTIDQYKARDRGSKE